MKKAFLHSTQNRDDKENDWDSHKMKNLHSKRYHKQS